MVGEYASGHAVAAGLYLVIVNIIVAFGVYFEAEKYKKLTGEKNAFFNPIVWFLVVLATGVVGAILFWLSHWLAPRKLDQ